MLINANLHHLLIKLIPFLEKDLKPLLSANAEYVEFVRTLNKEILPVLNQWFTGSLWYGAVAFALIIMLTVEGFLGLFFHVFPYILVFGIAMFLGSIVFFFPRLINRRLRTIVGIDNYYQVYMNILLEKRLKDNATAVPDDSE
jgi:hypothetical protein